MSKPKTTYQRELAQITRELRATGRFKPWSVMTQMERSAFQPLRDQIRNERYGPRISMHPYAFSTVT